MRFEQLGPKIIHGIALASITLDILYNLNKGIYSVVTLETEIHLDSMLMNAGLWMYDRTRVNFKFQHRKGGDE